MSRRLLITDRYDDRRLHAVGQAPADVLLLGLSNCWFRWRHGQPTAAWQLVDPAPHTERAAGEVGAYLVDLVARLPGISLGGETLGDLLRTPDGNEWWFLPITEKGPFRGPLVSQLYRVAIARAIIDGGGYDGVDVSLADASLADVFRRSASEAPPIVVHDVERDTRVSWRNASPFVRYWVHALGTVARFLAIRMLLAVWGRRPPAPEPGGLAAFTFYPIWWSRAFSSDASDRFFSNLDAARLSGYLAWLTAPGALWRTGHDALDVLYTHRITPLQAYVEWSDALTLLSMQRFARVRQFERGMRPLLRETFAGFDVGSLIGAELSQSMTGSEPCQDVLLSRAVGRAVAESAPRTVLYRIEFQPCENALLRGLRGRSRGIGFLHYPFGRHYLSTRFAPGEAERHVRAADPLTDRPMADGIVACGPAGIEHIADGGYPRSRCAECGPQRFGRLLEYRKTRKSCEAVRGQLGLPLDRRIYFVTLAIADEDTEALCGALGLALGRADGFRLVVRTHPNRPDGDASLRAALADFGPDRAILMDPRHDIYDHIVAADALVCIGSMIAFEAMALDRMSIVFDNPSSFPALSLAEFQSALFIAHDDRDLAAALGAIEEDSEAVREKRRRWPAMLRDVLGDLDTPLPAQLAEALSQLEHR
jgi:hypothetical protein